MSLPKQVTVTRAVTYHVEQLVKELRDDMGININTREELRDFLSDWVEEDLRQPINRHDTFWQDENGTEL
jgi:hypothetical protein